MPVLQNLSNEELIDLHIEVGSNLENVILDRIVGKDPIRPILDAVIGAGQIAKEPELRSVFMDSLVTEWRRIDSRIPDEILSPEEFMIFVGTVSHDAIKGMIKEDSKWIKSLDITYNELLSEDFNLPKRCAMKFTSWSEELTKEFLDLWKQEIIPEYENHFEKLVDDIEKTLPETNGLNHQEKNSFIKNEAEKIILRLKENKNLIMNQAQSLIKEQEEKIIRQDTITKFKADKS